MTAAIYYGKKTTAHTLVFRPPSSCRPRGRFTPVRPERDAGPGRRARAPHPLRPHPVAPGAAQLARRPGAQAVGPGGTGGKGPPAGGGAPADHGGRMTVRARVRLGIVCPYSLSIPGGVQHQVLGPGPGAAGHGRGGAGAGAVRRPSARALGLPSGGVGAGRRQRLGGAHCPRPLGRPAHDPCPAGRTVRHRPPPRALGPRPLPDRPPVQRRAAGGHLPPGRGDRLVPAHPGAGPMGGGPAKAALRRVGRRPGHGPPGPWGRVRAALERYRRRAGRGRRAMAHLGADGGVPGPA